MNYVLKGIELYVRAIIVIFGVISLVVLAPFALLDSVRS